MSSNLRPVIHQMWLDKRVKQNGPPDKYLPFIQTFKDQNPALGYEFWDQARVHWLFDTYPEKLDRYRRFYYKVLGKHHIERCDFARYLVGYAYDRSSLNIYVDLDFSCQRPLMQELSNRDFAWVVDPYLNNYKTFGLGYNENDFPIRPIFNGFFATIPNHFVWSTLLDYIMYTYEPSGIVYTSTGPLALGRCAHFNGWFDAPMYDQLFINRCLVIQHSVFNNYDKLDKLECSNIHPLIATRWYDGGYWMYDASPFYVAFYIKMWHIYLLIGTIVLAILLWMRLRRKTKDLSKCEAKVKVCNNRSSS